MKSANFIYWKFSGYNQIYTISNPLLSEISINEIQNSGFVFFPFNKINKGIFFEGKIEKCTKSIIKNSTKKSNFKGIDIDKIDFINLVKHAVETIKNTGFEKVVLARCNTILLNDKFNLHIFFKKLCTCYKNSFVYCLKVNDEIWIGATPELLLKNKNGQMTTSALAGTKPKRSEVKFGEKEITEQEYVKNYIVDVLQKNQSENIEISEKKQIESGNLSHIINEIKFYNNFPVKTLNELQPTPAVCGIPLDSSYKFIEQNENLDRSFYSGFLGPVISKNDFEIWVNIRCAKLLGNQIRLYAGAGITDESVPEKEWEETENKMNILRIHIE